MPTYSKNAMGKISLLCYTTADGTDVVSEWLEDQAPEVVAAMIVALDMISAWPAHQWRDEAYKELQDRPGSKCKGIGEIIIIAEPTKYRKKHCRILSYLGPKEANLTMLYPFNKDDQSDYGPLCAAAHQRVAEIEEDQTRAIGCQFS